MLPFLYVCRAQIAVCSGHDRDGSLAIPFNIDICLPGLRLHIPVYALSCHLFFLQDIENKGGIRVIADLPYERNFPSKLGSANRLVGSFASQCGGGTQDRGGLSRLGKPVNIEGDIRVDTANHYDLLPAEEGRNVKAVLVVEIAL